jgi:hypothetical protein
MGWIVFTAFSILSRDNVDSFGPFFEDGIVVRAFAGAGVIGTMVGAD